MLRRILLSLAVVGGLGVIGAATETRAAPVQPGSQISAAASPTVEKAQYRYERRRAYHRRRAWRRRHGY